MTPTDRLSGFGTGLATNSDSLVRVPQGHCEQYAEMRIVLIRLFCVAWLPDRADMLLPLLWPVDHGGSKTIGFDAMKGAGPRSRG